jgi:hypothetical protein
MSNDYIDINDFSDDEGDYNDFDDFSDSEDYGDGHQGYAIPSGPPVGRMDYLQEIRDEPNNERKLELLRRFEAKFEKTSFGMRRWLGIEGY